MSDQRVRLLFEPQSVAIVGASSDPTKASGLPLRNLLQSRFSGKIYPVNPRATEISGILCHPSVTDLPEAPDVAVLMVDARLSPQVLEECGRKGVKAAVVGSAGFSESGPEGQKLQTQLNAIAKQYEIRVCGPNCHGAFNVIKGIPVGYDHSFALPLSAGPVAIASHSGALLGVLGHRALQAGQGLSYLVSNGNEMDLDLCDFVEFFLEDEHTKVVAVLMEGLKNGPRFLELARRSHELRKTIVVLKVGKSERGAITTLAHTARMAGSGEVYEAAFRQFGVISTDTVEAFLGAAQLAAHQPVPRGGRLFVMTSSGAGASLMADKASEYGIELADISEEAKGRVPARRSAILTNPFDTAGASRSPGFLSAVCEAFAADTANDCLLMFTGPLAVRHEYARNFPLRRLRNSARPRQQLSISPSRRCAIFSSSITSPSLTARPTPASRYCAVTSTTADSQESELPNCRSERIRRRRESKPTRFLKLTKATAPCCLSRRRSVCCSTTAFNARTIAWFPTTQQRGTRPESSASRSFSKAMVAEVAHRSDAGLVSRKISNEAELQQEFAALEAKVRQTTNRSATISVEKYFPHDFELILGVKYDATFGPVILCGLGGVFTEILKDYALGLAPLTTTDAEDMLSSLKAFPMLQKSAALEPLTDALLRLSDLAVELNGKIAAVDINPIGLRSNSSAALVLDAKIHL